MVCQTLKPGVECFFMKKTGCSFNGGRCYPIVEQCEGCDRIGEYPAGRFCTTFMNPSLKWAKGPCSMATHLKREKLVETKKLNPLKASKRSMGVRA